MTTLRIVVLLLATILTGCPELGSQEPTTSGEIPENPTWTDVKPVLDEFCNDCHSSPPGDGGTGVAPPATLRLDVCENLGTPGAQSQAERIIVRVVDQFPTPMPPAAYSPQPTADDVELLRRWAEQGAPCEGSTVNGTLNNVATNNQMSNNVVANNQTANNQMTDDMGMTGMDTGDRTDMGADMPMDN